MRPPPLVETLPATPALEPAALWPAFAARPGCAFLDTALPGPRARFSLLACEPARVLRSGPDGPTLTHADGRVEHHPDAEPLALLRELLAARAVPRVPGLPFVGGAIGWLGYEAGAARERVFPKNPAAAPALPGLAFGLYDAALVYDHAERRAHLVAADAAGLARLRALVANPAPPAFCQSMIDDGAGARPELRPDLDRAAYTAALARIRDYIAAGDVYQVNFTHRFTAPFGGARAHVSGQAGRGAGSAGGAGPDSTVGSGAGSAAAAALYARLRALSPAPHAAYLDFGDHQLVSSTPERLLRVAGRRLETRPIKGTLPRLADPVADIAQRARLLASAKDHAELLMIVDLARNDLGRVAAPGSVQVEARHELESYATVHHLVATVTAELAPGLDRFDALRALHPGGSISGAPKIRALQIIAELEPVPRHAYTGALGYLGDDGDADLAIAIRTITCAGGLATYHVGGGITWDSDPAAEYEETLHKGRALQQALAGG